MIDTILKLKGVYKVFHVILILFCLGYLTNSCCEDYHPLDMIPIYKNRIKAIDPLDGLKDGMSDYVTF